jgi:cytochrome c-type biogenesis protein CcmE
MWQRGEFHCVLQFAKRCGGEALFREGQGVVAEGALDGSGVFTADTILAKHDETYMPKEVADALKKSGHWKDDYGRRAAMPAAGAGK